MELRDIHPWDLTPKQAVQLQRMLASQVIRRGAPQKVRYVAGADLSVHVGRRTGTGAVVVLTYPDLRLVELVAEEVDLQFPYVPGLLSFREVPALRPAFERLSIRPDLLIVDGQGLSHPRRFGIASHLGLLLGVPTIGCAKSRLIGEFQPPGEDMGSNSDLIHEDEVIGKVLRTRTNVKPVFVSIGYRISLEAAAAWVLRCCKGHRLPEPTRLAHQAANGTLQLPPPANERQGSLDLAAKSHLVRH